MKDEKSTTIQRKKERSYMRLELKVAAKIAIVLFRHNYAITGIFVVVVVIVIIIIIQIK